MAVGIEVAQAQGGNRHRLARAPEQAARIQIGAHAHVRFHRQRCSKSAVIEAQMNVQGAGSGSDEIHQAIGVDIADEMQPVDAAAEKSAEVREQCLGLAECAVAQLPGLHAVSVEQGDDRSMAIGRKARGDIPADRTRLKFKTDEAVFEIEPRRPLRIDAQFIFEYSDDFAPFVAVQVGQHQIFGLGGQAKWLGLVIPAGCPGAQRQKGE
ncbi:MAG: hypothetical protein F4234_08890 [Gammaproteobacteria bacterium]|nr:hypothetical protein [Gammaproteobacteria bacterium]